MIAHRSFRVLVAAGLAVLSLALVPTAGATGKTAAETSLLRAVNATRQANGLRPLKLESHLQNAARYWSQTLLHTNAFTHGDFGGRMRTFHVNGMAGENIAWGTGPYASARSVVNMWMNSPGHRANLLNPAYRFIGVGIATGTFQGYSGASISTADFGG
jgi:uncharacterized protein YkwD